jgi:hypothetical protein
LALGSDFTSILRGSAAAEIGAVTSRTPFRYSAVSLPFVHSFGELAGVLRFASGPPAEWIEPAKCGFEGLGTEATRARRNVS